MLVHEVLSVFVEERKSMTRYDVELRFSKVAIFRIADAITDAIRAGHLQQLITNSGKVHYKLTQKGAIAWANVNREVITFSGEPYQE